MPNTSTATVTCSRCAWSAQHTGDTEREVTAFLRWRLLAHLEEVHPMPSPHTASASASWVFTPPPGKPA